MAKFLALVTVVVVLFALVVTASGYMGGSCAGLNNVVGHATECAYRLVAGAKGNGAEGFAIALLVVALKKALRKGKLHHRVAWRAMDVEIYYKDMLQWLGLAESSELGMVQAEQLGASISVSRMRQNTENCLEQALSFEIKLYSAIEETYALLGEPACMPNCMRECAEDCPLRSRNNPF